MMRFLSNRFLSLGRRFLGGLLALSVVCLSWGDAAIAARTSPADSFTDSQIAQIRKARTQIAAAQSRIDELGQYIDAQDWTYTGNFIHGPLGDLRREAATINRNLPAKEQKAARKQAKELMSLVERIDAASRDKNATQAVRAFAKLEDSLDGFLSLVPNFEAEEPALASPAKTISINFDRFVDTVQDGAGAAVDTLEDAVEAVQETAQEAVDAIAD